MIPAVRSRWVLLLAQTGAQLGLPAQIARGTYRRIEDALDDPDNGPNRRGRSPVSPNGTARAPDWGRIIPLSARTLREPCPDGRPGNVGGHRWTPGRLEECPGSQPVCAATAGGRPVTYTLANSTLSS
jgi:hypothetical protein